MAETKTMELEILKFICANQGAVDNEYLLSNLGSSDAVRESILNREKFAQCCPFQQPKVVARTRLRLCRVKECRESCEELHLCKKFLLGGICRFGQTRSGCRFSHNLESFHNAMLLREHELEGLSQTELCTLLMQSDPWLLPQICFNYNNSGGCADGDGCKRLHVCETYLNTDCSCFKNHDFYAPQPSKNLMDRGVPDHLFDSLKSVYANITALKWNDKNDRGRGGFRGNRGNRSNRGNRGNQANQPQRTSSVDDFFAKIDALDLYSEDGLSKEPPRKRDPSESSTAGRGRGGNRGDAADGANRRRRPVKDKTEICMFFVKGHCKHSDEQCFKVHTKLPYRWEVSQDDGWTALPENEAIEKDYCDPKNTYSCSGPAVHFDTMTRGFNKVRRLSTANSLLEPTFLLTTEWVWYWEDETGKWSAYASAAGGHKAADMDSSQMERRFLDNDKDVVNFTAGSQSYSLSFPDMIQTNNQYGTKRLVRRRPRFVSAVDLQTKRVRRPPGPSNLTPIPDHWDKTQVPQTGYKRLSLLPSSDEFKEIETLFCETMRGFDIVKIERIQNKTLWEGFQLKKNHMKNKNNGRYATEKKLFHGTDSKFVDVICHSNFDWRICGVNGTVFGEGSYFARDAKYSHDYTGNSDNKSMFISRVLVGDYTLGSPSYRRPPSKDGGDINFYDSCVNDVQNPSIFVVFESHQIYPEYLLQYQAVDPFVALYGVRPAASSVRAAPKPTVSVYKPSTPVTKPSTPSYKPTTPVTKPSTPSYKPTIPVAQPSTPSYRSSTPVAQPSTPSYRSSTLFAQPSTPSYRSSTPVAQPSKKTDSCVIV